MINTPLISIIIPVYNVEKYLSDCLDSLISNYTNELNNDFEIILINDGSTDNSELVCKRYSLKYNFVKLYSQNNHGLSAARNLGIKKSKGQYLIFIDSDDLVISNFISIVISLINYTNSDLIFFKFRKVPDSFKFENIEAKKFMTNLVKSISKQEAMYDLTSSDWENLTWNKIYKKNLFDNIEFPVGKRYEDIFTTYKLVNLAHKIDIFNEQLYYYRQRMGSIQHEANKNKAFLSLCDCIEARMKQLVFFKKNNFKKAYESAEIPLLKNCIGYITLTDINNYLDKKNFIEVNSFLKSFDLKNGLTLNQIIFLYLFKHNRKILKFLIKIKNIL